MCMSVTLQPNRPKKGKKKVAAAPLAAKKVEPKKVVNPLFEKRPKNFGIGTLASCLVCSQCELVDLGQLALVDLYDDGTHKRT